MGSTYSMIKNWGEVRPVPEGPPTFDPLLGFPEGRKERVSYVTEQELDAARVDEEHRDYCAHYYLKLLDCKKRHYPLMFKCAPEKHAHDQCEYDDWVLRMKEFERERRLLNRQKKEMATAA